jgi:hypothetical protein
LSYLFVSVEILGVLALVLLFQLIPAPFILVDRAISKLEWWQPLAPFGVVLGTSIGLAWRILFPLKNSSILIQYPKYPQLRITTLCAIAFVALGAISSAVGIIGREELSSGIAGLLISCGYYCAGFSFFSMLAAAMVVRSIVRSGN